nr:hypothetical protein [uncultured Draconibacterium sp.]
MRTKYGIEKNYTGHYFITNVETKLRVDDMISLTKDTMSGKEGGEENPQTLLGLNLVIYNYGVRINYNEKSLK